MGDHIMSQQKRLGGTFAVAKDVARRETRDYLRSLMGPDLVFILLDTTLECMRERLSARHGGTLDEENMGDKKKFFELAGSDEDNTFNVTVDKDMDKEAVMKAVVDIIHKNGLA